MNKIFTFITHSSLFIALCALALNFYYTEQFDLTHNLYRLIVVFFGTLMSYIGVQLIPMAKNNIHHERSRWIKKQRIILYSLIATSLFAIVASIQYLSEFDLLNFAHLFIIILFYEKIFLDEKELRKIPYIKPFIISYVWSCVATAPVMAKISLPESYPVFLECFVFILALTLPFDIRDVEVDKLEGVKTLATVMSFKKVKMISFVLFILSLIMQFYYLELSMYHLMVAVLTFIAFILILFQVWPNQKEIIFLFYLDGLIMTKLLYLV